MQTRRSITVVLLTVASMWVVTSHAFMELAPFQYGYHVGAYAKIVFKVVDDAAQPVSNATVNVLFDMANMALAKEIIVQTDTNGICAAKERTKGVMKIHVSKEGYYSTNDEISFIDIGSEHDVKHGKWQPWGMEKQITLLPVKNPQAISASDAKWMWIKELNKWLGFDLVKYDFVKPYGCGEYSDMEIMFDWDGKWRTKEYGGIGLKLHFPDRFSGGYYADKTSKSEYEGIYLADPNANYQCDFAFFKKVASRNIDGYATSYEQQLFDQSKVLVVRSRCKLNDDGTLKSAQYFQLRNLYFSCSEKGAGIKFRSIYNSRPNDTNLEPKQ